MAPARWEALQAVEAGDVIFGRAPNRREVLLLVYDADSGHIYTRTVPTQVQITFRRDGESLRTLEMDGWTILSTARLPAADHAAAHSLDHRMSVAKGLSDYAMSEPEINLLATFTEFFNARLLPEE